MIPKSAIRGFVIDPFKSKVEYHCLFEPERVEGMYYKVYRGKDNTTFIEPHQLIPVAYVYPETNYDSVSALLKELAEAKKVYDEIQAKVFYKELPKWRLAQ